MTGGAKVTVAGAGALGLAAALALADAGCEVTVCDPGGAPSASAVAAGMLAPVFEAVLDPAMSGAFDILLAARDLWPAVEARAQVALDRSGAMAVGDEVWLSGVASALVRLGIHGIDLPRSTAQALAPGLSNEFARGFLVREDWRVEPVSALSALHRAAAATGVTFEQRSVEGLGEADWLVIASGADARLAKLAPELSVLTPVKGQIARYPAFRDAGVCVRGEGAYVVPGSSGAAVGATMEEGVSDTAPDPVALAPVLAAGARLFPRLDGAETRLAAGIRAATPDGLPLAGLSSAPEVILATGARRNGWLLAPLVAQIVAACVTGREAGPWAARLDPRRFGGVA